MRKLWQKLKSTTVLVRRAIGKPSPTSTWINTRVEWDKHGNEIYTEGYWYEGELALAHTAANIDQDSYRWRADDGSESAATWLELANTSHDFDVSAGNIQTRLRFLIQEDAGGSSKNFIGTLEFQINGGGYVSLGAATTGAIYYNSANLTDAGDTTSQIGVGTFITPNQGISELGSAGGVADFAGNDETEYEYTVELVAADLANGDSLDFRINEVNTFTNIANATITIGAVSTVEIINKGNMNWTAQALKVNNLITIAKAAFNWSANQFKVNIAVIPAKALFNFIGQNIKIDFLTIIGAGTWQSWVGQAVSVSIGSTREIVAGAFNWTAQALTTVQDTTVIVVSGAFNFTGQAINAVADYIVDITTGAFNFTGQTLQAIQHTTIEIVAGAFNWLGRNVIVLRGDAPVEEKAVNDAKLNKLETALAKTGHINDLEVEWLQSLHVSVTSDDLDTAWHQYWDTITTPAPIPAGQRNDRAYAWLGGLGYTGTLSKRWFDFWSAP